MAVRCILLKDGIATKKTKSLIPKGKSQQQYQSLQGSLWTLDPGEYDGPHFSSQKADLSKLTIKLKSLEDPSICYTCQASDVARLTEIQCDLLKAISTCADRYKVFQEQPWMNEAAKINVNSIVYVINIQGLQDRAVAIVRYKGTIVNMEGIMFGLELSDDYAGKGTSDGTYRKQRYFSCELDNGLFVPISKIRRCPDISLFTKIKDSHMPVEHQEPTDNSPGEPPPQLSIGERVVWMDDEGLPQMAVVHWLGKLPDGVHEWTVGVEFENKIGTGTGKYKDTQLFKAKNGYASLIPVMGLMKAEEFYGGAENMPSPERYDVSPGPIHGEGSQSTVKNLPGQANAPKQIVLDENYYRESYKTNRPPKPPADNNTKDQSTRHSQDADLPTGGEYDVLRSRQNQQVDPIYACVGDVRNEQMLDGPSRNIRGSHSDVIYTLPNKAKNVAPRPHTDSNLLHKRTIVVSNFPTSRTVQAEVHDGLEDRRQHPQNISSTNAQVNVPSTNHIVTPHHLQQPVLTHSGHNINTPTTSTRKNNSPVMHEDIKEINKNNGPNYALGNTSTFPPTRVHQYNDNVAKPKTIPSPTKEPQEKMAAKTLQPAEVGSDFDIGSVVEVMGNPDHCKYGVIRWIGYLQDKTKPIVGLEMEEESSACTDGTFGGYRMFDCPSKKAFFVYLTKVRKDSRFEENEQYLQRTVSMSFGSLDCPDVQEDIPPNDDVRDVRLFCGRNKGIQGHHNSCYLDASLFSMFAFSQTFDALLFREREANDIEQYDDVQYVLKNGIVNPLRKNMFVRADKVLKLRTLLDKLSNVQGLMSEEKDPEEFFSCLLQQILRTEPLLRFSNGQTSYLYQLFVERDNKLILPTTEQLIELSFLQGDLKLSEVPNCLILQMPRFGKDYKMYNKIVPSLYLDITDILEHGPRECHLCGGLATHECKDCFQLNVFESGLYKTAFCENCLQKYHQHRTRQLHKRTTLQRNAEYEHFLQDQSQTGQSVTQMPMPREKMELFAVICIETSHYVAFVKCGHGKDAPWVLFDSMADRMGAENGYNIPEIKPCKFLPEMLIDLDKLLQETEKNEKELGDLKRLLCDGYICMYRSEDLYMYN